LQFHFSAYISSVVTTAKYNGADVIPCNHRIAYTLGDNDFGQEFYLCYILNFSDYTISVDVSNSTIRRI